MSPFKNHTTNSIYFALSVFGLGFAFFDIPTGCGLALMLTPIYFFIGGIITDAIANRKP
jgi:hypothetical protein